MQHSVAKFVSPDSDERPEPGHLWSWQTPEDWTQDEPGEQHTHWHRHGIVSSLALFGEEAGEIVAGELAEQLPTAEEMAELEALDNAARRTPTERKALSANRPEPAGSHCISLAFWVTHQTREKNILSEVSEHDREDIRQEFVLAVWSKAFHDELHQTRTWKKELRQSVRRLIRLRGRSSKRDATAAGSSDEATELRRLSIESKIEIQERHHLATIQALQQGTRKALFEFTS